MPAAGRGRYYSEINVPSEELQLPHIRIYGRASRASGGAPCRGAGKRKPPCTTDCTGKRSNKSGRGGDGLHDGRLPTVGRGRQGALQALPAGPLAPPPRRKKALLCGPSGAGGRPAPAVGRRRAADGRAAARGATLARGGGGRGADRGRAAALRGGPAGPMPVIAAAPDGHRGCGRGRRGGGGDVSDARQRPRRAQVKEARASTHCTQHLCTLTVNRAK